MLQNCPTLGEINKPKIVQSTRKIPIPTTYVDRTKFVNSKRGNSYRPTSSYRSKSNNKQSTVAKPASQKNEARTRQDPNQSPGRVATLLTKEPKHVEPEIRAYATLPGSQGRRRRNRQGRQGAIRGKVTEVAHPKASQTSSKGRDSRRYPPRDDPVREAV
jgi:hypothetical protein